MNRKSPRRLEAKLDTNNRIDSWTCSACAWTKVPENRHIGPTPNTVRAFEEHKCEDHPVVPSPAIWPGALSIGSPGGAPYVAG